MIEKKEGASTMANMPGAYVKILEADVSRVPRASGITVVTSVAEAEELYGKDSQVAATMRRYSDHVTIGARDTRTAPIVGALQPGDTVGHSTGSIHRAAKEIIVAEIEILHMARARMREQVAAGGVDCKETRRSGLRRVKAEARVIGEMQDAVRMVNGWPVKRKRCRTCGAAIPEYSPYAGPGSYNCGPCIHRLCHEGAGRERVGAPGIAIDKTPGPHEGARAWASPCWEDL